MYLMEPSLETRVYGSLHAHYSLRSPVGCQSEALCVFDTLLSKVPNVLIN